MPKISDVCQFLNSFAPTRLAEDWDNVGLLTGDRQIDVQRIMTCLTITPESAEEAIARDADLIVAHHPLPFRPIKKMTTDNVSTQMLWNLARHNISIYSPHTGFDSAREGINQSLAERLHLTDVRPLSLIEGDPDQLGSGRVGAMGGGSTLDDLAQSAKNTLKLPHVRVVGALDLTVSQVAVACGSGGSFLSEAIKQGLQYTCHRRSDVSHLPGS